MMYVGIIMYYVFQSYGENAFQILLLQTYTCEETGMLTRFDHPTIYMCQNTLVSGTWWLSLIMSAFGDLAERS